MRQLSHWFFVLELVCEEASIPFGLHHPKGDSFVHGGRVLLVMS